MINRRAVLTGAAVVPFVPGVAGAGDSPRTEMLHPKDWKCHVDRNGDVCIDAYVHHGNFGSIVGTISFTRKSNGGENSNHSHEVWNPSVELYES